MLRSFKLPLIVFLGLSLGFILPQIGLFIKPFLSYLLMIIMFFTCLKTDLADFRKIGVKTILIGLFFIFVFMPLLSLGGMLFTPLVFAGILVAFSCPSAAVSAFYSNAYKGNTSLAIVLTTIASLISVITLPLTMLIGVGTSIKFDAISIILNLTQIILIPLFVAALMRRYLRKTSEKVCRYDKTFSYILILFVLWGGVASGVSYIEGNVYEFLQVNLIVTLLLLVALAVPYIIGKRFSREVAITMSITSFVKNGILALVIGSITFGSGVVPVLVANIIDQNALLVILGLLLKRKQF
jgi:predicted Na+-dependent transporter